MTLMAEFCILEPVGRKFFTAICHVLSSKDAEGEHLLRRELGEKPCIEVFSFGLRQNVRCYLHAIIHVNDGRPHAITSHS